MQQRRLAAILDGARGTAFARDHCLERFRDAVPPRDFEGFRSYIERIQASEPNVLTREPVLWLEPTSGTGSQPKLIPYTASFLAELRAAVEPWLGDILLRHPALVSRRLYIALSPASGGAVEETDYLSGPLKHILEPLMAVPPSVRSASGEEWQRLTLTHLLACEDLGAISVWSPSFLTVLLDAIPRHLPAILPALPTGRARCVKSASNARQIWPKLELVSCWTEGHAARSARQLEDRLGGVPIEPKGLLSTEGVVTTPLGAAYSSHFLEFLPAGEKPQLLEQLDAGQSYEVLLTTSAGLYRYRTGDTVQCTGRQGALPELRFTGRAGRVSDLTGEKLHEAAVELALRPWEEACRFRLLAARLEPSPGYTLVVEAGSGFDLEHMREAVERELSRNPHYELARRLGQLAPLSAVRVNDGEALVMAAAEAVGRRTSTLKRSLLETDPERTRRLLGHQEAR